MLVIARKTGQKFLIGDEVEITIASIKGDQVRLAINAPRRITVLRAEVVDQVAQGNAAAITGVDAILEFLNNETSDSQQKAA